MTRLFGGMGSRGVVVAGAYLVTALVTLSVIFVFGRLGDAALLREILAVHLIAGLSGGLEPGTAKAAALRGDRNAQASDRSMLAASGLKGMAASPILILVWRLADPKVPLGLLVCVPLICLAGFMATDLRVQLDLRGRHASAIWLKQGGLAGGLVIIAVLAALGTPLPFAVAAASVARLVSISWVASLSAPVPASWKAIGAHIGDIRWAELAGSSVIAAFGGSADRVMGLRFLTAAQWADYYVLYEIFSKFWFIPYVLAPIIFARAASGVAERPIVKQAILFTAALGGVFVVIVAGALLAEPHLPTRLLGARAGNLAPNGAIVAFALGVAINGVVQLRLAELQGGGHARRVLVVMTISAVITTALFFFAARRYGVAGLLTAWLIKSLIEVVAAYCGVGWSRPAVGGWFRRS